MLLTYGFVHKKLQCDLCLTGKNKFSATQNVLVKMHVFVPTYTVQCAGKTAKTMAMSVWQDVRKYN